MLFPLIIGVYAQTMGKCYVQNRTTTTAISVPTQPALPAPKQPTPAPKQPTAQPAPKTASQGIRPRAFTSPQVGIGSWFRANAKSDDTNGNSWCGYPYKDHTPGFAPDLAQMSQGTLAVYPHPRWEEFGREYCGLEAIVRNPDTGVEMTLYITDAFDPKWVRSRGSIDIHINAYQRLTQSQVLDKNRVIKAVEWRLTGNRNPRYAFKGQGDR
jgi:hypothetical protein